MSNDTIFVAWISSDYFESLLLPQTLLRGENDSKQSDEFQATIFGGVSKILGEADKQKILQQMFRKSV